MVAPVADIVLEGDSGAVVLRQAIADKGRGHWLTRLQHLRQNAAVELGDGCAVAGDALWEEHHGNASRCRSLESCTGARRRAAPAALHIDGARHGGHPSEKRDGLHLNHGDEDDAMRGRNRHDVQVSHVVGDDGSVGGEVAFKADLDSHFADRLGGELVQPFGP